MFKPALMAWACGCAAMAQQQLTIQLAPPDSGALHPLKIVRRGGAQATAEVASGNLVTPITAPVSGYDTDPTGALRPILGFGAFSIIGSALDLGENIASMVPSPNQNYLVEIAESGVASLWVDVNGGLGQVAFPSDVSGTTSVVPSPLGFAVAVLSKPRGIVQVFSSLPTAPALAFSPSFSDLGGEPSSLAVSDDGSTLLYTLRAGRQESLYSIQSGGAPRFVDAGSFGAFAFSPNSLDMAVAQLAGGRVFLFHYVNGAYAASLLSEEGAGDSRPTAMQFSRDGQQVVIANSGPRTIQTLRIDGTGGSTTPCSCAPAMLTRLIGNSVFQITRFDGSAATIFLGDIQPAVVSLIGVAALAGSN